MNLYTMQLEDGKDYIIIDTIVNKDNKYVIFVTEDESNFTIRKVIDVNNKESIVKLDSKEEYNEVINIFYKKHKGEK